MITSPLRQQAAAAREEAASLRHEADALEAEADTLERRAAREETILARDLAPTLHRLHQAAEASGSSWPEREAIRAALTTPDRLTPYQRERVTTQARQLLHITL